MHLHNCHHCQWELQAHTETRTYISWVKSCLTFFFCNVRAKWFLHLDSKAERKRKNKTNKKNCNKQICPGRCLPSSLHIAWGIQLLGPQALPPPLRPSCKELACHSQVQFKNSVNLNFKNDFFSYFQTHEAWLSFKKKKIPNKYSLRKKVKTTGC